MRHDLRLKVNRLTEILRGYKRVISTLSGGVDSTLLLKFALSILGRDNVLSVTFVSPIYSIRELKEVKRLLSLLKPKHLFLLTDELADRNFTSNPPQRCYFCKKSVYQELLKIKELYRFSEIIEGTNVDDLKDYRPGREALQRLDIKSPFLLARIGKKDIRTLAKKFSLPNYDKPSNPCLASRIPFFRKITEAELESVEKGEEALRELGLPLIRLRKEGETARIESDEKGMRRIWQKRGAVVQRLKRLGYRYITIDLEGYRPSGLRWKGN